MLLMTALFCSALATDGLTARDTPQETFRDVLRSGDRGPEMVVIPPGRFRMGCDRGTHPVCGRRATPCSQAKNTLANHGDPVDQCDGGAYSRTYSRTNARIRS